MMSRIIGWGLVALGLAVGCFGTVMITGGGLATPRGAPPTGIGLD